MGLQQGSVLSPALFSLFINNIEKYLDGGGVRIEHVLIKLLAYADDIVLLATEPQSLQYMINSFYNYTRTWNLNINLQKSKIIVFSKGGKLAKKEKWFLDGNKIEIVNYYKYLGLGITPKIVFNKHLKEKLEKSKNALNSVWQEFMNNNCINLKSKQSVFNSVCRSTMCYGAEIWGGKTYAEVDMLLTFFIKKLMKVPKFTPNYFVYLENNLYPLFLHTLKLPHNYLIKVLGMPHGRLPNILARIIIQKEIFWYKDIIDLANNYNINLILGVNNLDKWKETLFQFRKQIKIILNVNFHEQRMKSKHSIYSILNFNLGKNNYLTKLANLNYIRYIYRIRGDMLQLNYDPYNRTELACPIRW